MMKSLSFLAIVLASCAHAQPVPAGQISTALANVKPSICDADSGSWKPWSINCDFDCDGSGWEIDCDCDKKNKDCSDIRCKIDQGTDPPLPFSFRRTRMLYYLILTYSSFNFPVDGAPDEDDVFLKCQASQVGDVPECDLTALDDLPTCVASVSKEILRLWNVGFDD